MNHGEAEQRHNIGHHPSNEMFRSICLNCQNEISIYCLANKNWERQRLISSCRQNSTYCRATSRQNLQLDFWRLPATQISLRISAVWTEFSLIAFGFYSIQAIQSGINVNPWHTRRMYRLLWVFAGHTGLIRFCRALAQYLMSTFNVCYKEIRKFQYFWIDIFKAILSFFLTFIDHRSRMTQIDSFEFHFFINCL